MAPARYAGDVTDLYALLGVSASADDAELRRAWRRLALQLHPDVAGDEMTARFQRIAEAYGVLSDPAARAAYDRSRGSAAPEPQLGRRAPGQMLRRVCAPLNALFARGVASLAADGVIDLFLEPDEVAEGGMVTISMRVLLRCEPCARCGGTGTVEDLFAAWLAVRPGVTDGTVLTPSARLPGMMRPVLFRVRV